MKPTAAFTVTDADTPKSPNLETSGKNTQPTKTMLVDIGEFIGFDRAFQGSKNDIGGDAGRSLFWWNIKTGLENLQKLSKLLVNIPHNELKGQLSTQDSRSNSPFLPHLFHTIFCDGPRLDL